MSELSPYRTVEDELGVVVRVHAVDRTGIRRFNLRLLLAMLTVAGLIALVSPREKLAVFGVLSGGISAAVLVAWALTSWLTPNVVVRERGLEIGSWEPRTRVPFAAVGRGEARGHTVRLHLKSGDRVKLVWVTDPEALLAAIRDAGAPIEE